MNDMNLLFAKNVEVTRKMKTIKVNENGKEISKLVSTDYCEIVGHGFQGNIKAHPSIITGGYPVLLICTKVKQNIDTFRDNDTKEERDSIGTSFRLFFIPEQVEYAPKSVPATQGITAPTVKRS